MSLQGKVAVITGGNSGIGYASAKELKTKGAQVVIAGRSAKKVEKAAAELGVTGLVADVSDVAAIGKLADQVADQFGKVDILFVNAGVYIPGAVGQVTEETFDQQMAINFKGAVFTIEKFLPILNDGASIINLSSVMADSGMPGGAIYSASKAALNTYTRTAAMELSARKIRVNAINPGPVSTPIFSKTGLPEETLNTFAAQMQERVPLKRFGQPEEIAHLVSFLASDEAAFITGGAYNIDGGVAVLT